MLFARIFQLEYVVQLLRLQQRYGVTQWQVGVCYSDLLSTVLVLTAEVLTMPQLTCLV